MIRLLALSATLLGLGLGFGLGCGGKVCPDDMIHDRQRSRGRMVVFCIKKGDASRSLRVELYDSRRQKESCPFVGARPGGDYQAWHKNGARYLEGRYENGLKTGRWTQWADDGRKVGDAEYRDGLLIQGAPIGTPASCESVTW